jgi:hypothetical protein
MVKLGRPEQQIFYCLVKARQARNSINCLLDEIGINWKSLLQLKI